MKIGFAILAIVFCIAYHFTKDTGLSLVAVCVVLVLLPPRFDPAIQIKEWQIKQGWHPESPEQD